ncbi:helix-turn-helix domain-containing protein [Weissella ceti]
MRYFRLQSQLRKKELAALLNVDTSTISNYERGDADLTLTPSSNCLIYLMSP